MSRACPLIVNNKGYYDQMVFWLQDGALWAQEAGTAADPFQFDFDYAEGEFKAMARAIESSLRESAGKAEIEPTLKPTP